MGGVYLVLIGLIGVSGMTWLCPWAASLWAAGREREALPKKPREFPRSVVVGIPARNEEGALGATLQSVEKAVRALRTCRPDVAVRLVVGDDGSTDRTAEEARRLDAEVISNERAQGKWAMLRRLAAEAGEAEWLVFADAGAVWPEELLNELLETGADSDVLAVAPSYRRPGAGAIESLVWAAERLFKSWENRAGGPVSVHGATVMYRVAPLREVFRHLAPGPYLNDDVVLPLTLRRLFPQQRIVYRADLVVHDGGKAPPSERRRRRRMMLGNIQALRPPQGVPREALVEFVASRRIFRMFWAYWFVFLGAGLIRALAAYSPPIAAALGGVAAVVLVWPGRPRGLTAVSEAASASLRAPLDIGLAAISGGVDAGGAAWR